MTLPLANKMKNLALINKIKQNSVLRIINYIHVFGLFSNQTNIFFKIILGNINQFLKSTFIHTFKI